MKVLASAIALTSAQFFASAAFAAPPPAPVLSVGVTDIRQLEFNWEPVSGAQSYELWFLAAPGAPWVKYREQRAQRAPLFRVGVPVHLLDWQQARYYIKACNWGGCTASNEVGVDGLQLDAIGYFKPPLAGALKYFGFNIDLSADGTALAVISSEPIAGNQRAATINVYRRTSPQSSWRLEARLVAEPRAPGSTSGIGDPIAISADGNTIAYGNWVEYQYTGGVYLFRRGAAGWAQTQRITGRAGGADQFGINVKLDSAGRTLVVGRNQPGLERRDGTLEVYQDPDDGSDQFVHATTVPTPPFDDPQWGWCRAVDLSDAGHIVRSCFSGAPYAPLYTQVFQASTSGPLHYTEVAQLPGGADVVIGIDSAGTRVALPAWAPNAHVAVYRNDAGNWVTENTLGPFPTGVKDIAISNDGRFIAVGMNDDTLVGRGPLFGPLVRSHVQSGSVGVFERKASGWRLRRYVKADSDNALHSFGYQVVLSENGHVLAVGSPYDASASSGIDGDRDDQSVSGRGAVWLY